MAQLSKSNVWILELNLDFYINNEIKN